ncbi:MAG: peroxiredoxin [Bacteroidetes bacterium]|nr:MAG: peroxiredoxin [Bacteroidota bacterium]
MSYCRVIFLRNFLVCVSSFLCLALKTNGQSTLAVGDTIPRFTLHDQDGNIFDSKDYVGKRILVIYFYPKDESTVCTKEACAFRDNYSDFAKRGAMVIGINSGTVESHKEFQQHHQLPFVLLSDPGSKVLKLFGVKNKFFISGRETFVVGQDGKIVYTFNSMMQGTKHASEALRVVESSK